MPGMAWHAELANVRVVMPEDAKCQDLPITTSLGLFGLNRVSPFKVQNGGS